MTAPDSLRLFVAIDPPPSVRSELADLAEPLVGVRWSPLPQLHLTLRFLGDVTDELRERVEPGLAGIRVVPFHLPTEGIGAFPPKGAPRVLWAGVGRGHPHLFQLRQRLDDALLGCGLDLDVRVFQPHVTLGRCGSNAARADVARWLRDNRDFAGAVFRVEEFTLYRSDLGPNGAVHTVLRRFVLCAE